MKNKLIISAIIVLAIFFTIKGVTGISGKGQSEEEELRLKVTSSKEIFLLGEIVPLTFRLTNEGTESLRFVGDLDAKDGNLKILMSEDGKHYKKYFRSDWKVADKKPTSVLLKPQESLVALTGILWNSVPRVTNLSELAEKQLTTNYVFMAKGTYFVKVVLPIYTQNKQFEIESDPLQITVEEPVGEDLKVWNKIKDNGDIAYLMQEGDFKIPSYKTKERGKLQQEVEQILVDYPNSFYAQSFKQSLEKFQVIEEKRRAFEEKMKANKPD